VNPAQQVGMESKRVEREGFGSRLGGLEREIGDPGVRAVGDRGAALGQGARSTARAALEAMYWCRQSCREGPV